MRQVLPSPAPRTRACTRVHTPLPSPRTALSPLGPPAASGDARGVQGQRPGARELLLHRRFRDSALENRLWRGDWGSSSAWVSAPPAPKHQGSTPSPGKRKGGGAGGGGRGAGRARVLRLLLLQPRPSWGSRRPPHLGSWQPCWSWETGGEVLGGSTPRRGAQNKDPAGLGARTGERGGHAHQTFAKLQGGCSVHREQRLV